MAVPFESSRGGTRTSAGASTRFVRGRADLEIRQSWATTRIVTLNYADYGILTGLLASCFRTSSHGNSETNTQRTHVPRREHNSRSCVSRSRPLSRAQSIRRRLTTSEYPLETRGDKEQIAQRPLRLMKWEERVLDLDLIIHLFYSKNRKYGLNEHTCRV